MTVVWVMQSRDDTRTYHDTEHAALSKQAALPRPTYPVGRATPTHETVVYPIDVEPAPRGDAYWDRTTRKAAA